MTSGDEVLRELDRLIRRDPARRGIASVQVGGRPLAEGGLSEAADSIAANATAIAIATGFAVVDESGARAETDGPPGAVYLASALQALGIEATLVSDAVAGDALRFGCEMLSLDPAIVIECPFEAEDTPAVASLTGQALECSVTDAWVDTFLHSATGRRLSHVIAIERAGPSHTLASMLSQTRGCTAPQALFFEETTDETRNHCLNMRGDSIDRHTAKIHRLFERIADERPAITTIGIADGGNEIGCGNFPWEVIRDAVPTPNAGSIACRIATDHTILAGVSNWGAYALAAAVLYKRGKTSLMRGLDATSEGERLERFVHEAGLIDGVTALGQATVDGLPLETYLQTLIGIRRAIGLDA